MNNDILIDITMTATRRPSILVKTLDSFYSGMFNQIADQCRIIINIDPAGEDMPSYEMSKYVEIYCQRYVIGMPMTASFPRAFRWCWEQSDAPWVFHLEDDWELLKKIDIMDMIRIMEKHEDLGAIRLSMFPSGPTPIDMMKNWNRWLPWNGEFYEVKEEERHRIGVCGHPTLFRKEFIENALPFLDPTKNPEKQFQGTHKYMVEEVLKWRYGVYAKPGDQPSIRDIGRDWMKQSGLQKQGNKAFFTNWEKSDA